MAFKYEIEKEIAAISDNGLTKKMLTVTSWNGNPGKLDLRAWLVSDDTMRPGKGITLNDEEAGTLLEALTAYLKGEQ